MQQVVSQSGHKVKRFALQAGMLVRFLRDLHAQTGGFRSNLPPDARVIGVAVEPQYPATLLLFVESETFPLVMDTSMPVSVWLEIYPQ